MSNEVKERTVQEWFTEMMKQRAKEQIIGINLEEVEKVCADFDEKDGEIILKAIETVDDNFKRFIKVIHESLDDRNSLKLEKKTLKFLKDFGDVFVHTSKRGKTDSRKMKNSWKNSNNDIVKLGSVYKVISNAEDRPNVLITCNTQEEAERFIELKSKITPLACKIIDNTIKLLEDARDFMNDVCKEKESCPDEDVKMSFADFKEWQNRRVS